MDANGTESRVCPKFHDETRVPLEFGEVEPSLAVAVAWKWLTNSFAGERSGSACRSSSSRWCSAWLDDRRALTSGLDTVGDLLIVIAAVIIGYYLFVDVKRLILWRVRRKLTLSYIFIAFVPAILIICFFVLAGLLLFFSVSAYSDADAVQRVEDQARVLAETAAFNVARSASAPTLNARSATNCSRRWPVSAGVVSVVRRGTRVSRRKRALRRRRERRGGADDGREWRHVTAPDRCRHGWRVTAWQR